MSRHHRAAGWGGPVVAALRARFALAIAEGRDVRCAKCKRLLDLTDQWDLGHQVDLSESPERAFDLSNLWPEHVRCSRAGGAAITNAKRRNRRMRPNQWL